MYNATLDLTFVRALEFSLSTAPALVLLALPVVLVLGSMGAYKLASVVRRIEWRWIVVDYGHYQLAFQATDRRRTIAHAIASTRVVSYTEAIRWYDAIATTDLRAYARFAPLVALLAVVSFGCGYEMQALAATLVGGLTVNRGRRADLEDRVRDAARDCADECIAADPDKVRVSDPLPGDWDHYHEVVGHRDSSSLQRVFVDAYRARLEEYI